jgi:COP9 signalosome complex subunit 5
MTKSETAKNNPTGADARYHFDEEKLQELKKSAPWMSDPKYFKAVALSPSAIMKIMMHCQSGVEKGISKGGNPIEVMGMLLGRPDPTTPETLIVTDAFPLPIEGFETRVVADDEDVVNHMIALGESLERTRKEKFMGWYHSHPFDLGDHSHCFFSQTDLSTQLQWQRAEDPHGCPFVGLVVDPLRSTHLQIPVIKAFRAYPPEYKSSVHNECPDGSVEPSEQQRLELWGSCWARYYELVRDVSSFVVQPRVEMHCFKLSHPFLLRVL